MTSFVPRRPILTKPVKSAPDPNAHIATGLAGDLEAQAVADTKIMQKVNGAHLDAFEQRYPRQVRHCLRLTMERLQRSFEKQGEEDPGQPSTWRLNTSELADLARAAYYLEQISKGL